MPKIQAPILAAKGEKFQNEPMKAIMGWELKEFIYNNLGERDFAMWKVMDYCITNASEAECVAKNKEPYRLTEETIAKRINVSKDGYLRARKKLEAKKWLQVADGRVYVLYDELYKQVKEWKKNLDS